MDFTVGVAHSFDPTRGFDPETFTECTAEPDVVIRAADDVRQTLQCKQPTVGRYLSIYLGSVPMTFCDLEVHGHPVGKKLIQ